MFDAFSQLQLPRRPWLDESVVRDAFHRLATVHHPDKDGGGTEAFSDLTTAYETLRHPQGRLRHLLELESVNTSAPASAVPAELITLFPVVASARQRLGALQEKRRSAANALARSLLATERADVQRAAEAVQESLDLAYEAALADLRSVDATWPDDAARGRLAALHARFVYLSKWRDQLRESLLQLELS